jgi:putative ABC transport system permease protein
MDAINGFWKRLRAIVNKPRADRDLDEEIRTHIDLETEKNIKLGLTPDEARRRARIAFGGVEAMKEEHRDGRGTRWLEDLVGDTRYALRALSRAPVLAVTAIITLALGIGANTAIFSAVSAVILRPLPFTDAGRLMKLGEDNEEYHWRQADAAPANLLDWKDRVHAFQDVAAYTNFTPMSTLTGDGPPQLLRTNYVTGNFFSVLGVQAELGRTFTDDETWETNANVAMISHRMWRDQFASSPGIIGRTITLNGRSVQIIGVVPATYSFPGMDIDIWRNSQWDRADRAKVYFRRAHWLQVIARLRPGVTPEAANAEFQTVVKQLQTEYPATNAKMGAGMTPLHAALIGNTRRPLLVLLGAVAMLLLIACANVGNLLLTHAVGRDREVAVRLALGAGRGRIIRQALTESLVLSALGGAAGLALGWWATGALLALRPAALLPVTTVGLDWRVLAFVAAITTASGVLFGIAPALWSARRAPAESLKEGGRGGSAGHRMRRWGNVLVVGEVALALLLTVGAGLFIRSLWELQRVDPGFEPSGLMTAEIDLPGVRYDSVAKVVGFFGALGDRLRGLPGVQGVATASQLPLTGAPWSSDFAIEGAGPDGYGTNIVHREISAEYQPVMRVKLLAGRLFGPGDTRGSPNVVLINASLAKHYFANREPLGARIAFDRVPDAHSTWRTIVGVVGDERQEGPGAPSRDEVFAPFAQDLERGGASVIVRASGDPMALAPAIRSAVREMDPNLAITELRTMDTVAAKAVAQQRFLATMLLVFAGVGLLLSVVGVYGVMAQLAADRAREMGIRVALGARAGQVQWLVVRRGLRLVAIGVGVGLAAAVLATRAVSALLYGVGALDPLTFTLVPVLLVITALVATWLPARRASRADPVGVMRNG